MREAFEQKSFFYWILDVLSTSKHNHIPGSTSSLSFIERIRQTTDSTLHGKRGESTSTTTLDVQTLPVFTKKNAHFQGQLQSSSSSSSSTSLLTTSQQSRYKNHGGSSKSHSTHGHGHGHSGAASTASGGGDDDKSIEDVTIYMDWPVDDKLFTLENYKAFESILTVYPMATVRILLPASVDAWDFKVCSCTPASFRDAMHC
jgi:hypothetical protein